MRAERQLQLSRERYRRLFHQQVAGVFRSEARPDGRVIECNQRFAETFGYDFPAAQHAVTVFWRCLQANIGR